MHDNHQNESRSRAFFRWILALSYLTAGILHIRSPGGFLAITPDWVPFAEEMVFLTGLAEIAGAIGLLVPPQKVPRIRFLAGIGLAVYALCVWPANFNHALNNIAIDGVYMSWGYHGPRLLLQPIIIWWALYAGGVTNWPFHSAKAGH